jgi:uncharacterized membrane protein YtjA (UPF0391 family)
MLSWPIMFLVIGLIAGVLGFTGVIGAASLIASVLFVIFLVLFFVSRARSAQSSTNGWSTAVARSCKYTRFRCQP